MTPTITDRVKRLDWPQLTAEIEARGYAVAPPVVTPGEGRVLVADFDDDSRYRSIIDMRRHRFGSGLYKYYDHPLPAVVDELRHALYEQLVPIADEWAGRLDVGQPYPATLDAMINRCTGAGQTRPTPLIFRYAKDDFNTLHQDVYGDISFPLQAMTVLNRPDDDFTGGEFLLVTQVPRAQSVGEVVTSTRGQLVIFANSIRPMPSTRGWYGAKVRHGVSRVRSGTRYTLGVIFHDAR